MKTFFQHFGQKAVPTGGESAQTVVSPRTPEIPNREIRQTESASPGHGNGASVPPSRTVPDEVLTLTLGDFLDRIPVELLEEAEHDRSRPLEFDLEVLSERIWRCDTQIPISAIFQRVPDVFREKAIQGPGDLIRFPWNKVQTLIAQARESGTAPGLTALGVERLVSQLTSRKLHLATPPATLLGLRTPEPPAPWKSPGLVGPERAAAAAPNQRPTADLAMLAVPLPASEPQKAGQPPTLATLTAERDQALAAKESLREELARHHKQMELERRMAAAISGKYNRLQEHYVEIDQRIVILEVERDAAVALAEKLNADADATAALIAKLTTGPDPGSESFRQLTTERDAALALSAELSAEREAAMARMEGLEAKLDAGLASTAEREATIESLKQLTTERDAALARIAELSAELDEAMARAEGLGAKLDAALASSAEREAMIESLKQLTFERDTAAARAEGLNANAAAITAERDAALARTAELSAERDAAMARVEGLGAKLDAALASTPEREATIESLKQLTFERDTAAARAEELNANAAAITAERDAATDSVRQLTAQCNLVLAHNTELRIERDAALAVVTKVTVERETPVARTAELSTERDAAVTCAAEFLEANKKGVSQEEPADNAARDSSAIAGLKVEIEGYRHYIETLLAERDERDAMGEQDAQPMHLFVQDDQSTDLFVESLPTEGESDAYATLFPPRWAIPSVVWGLALGIVVVGLLLIAQINPIILRNSQPKGAPAALPSKQAQFHLPAVTAKSFPEVASSANPQPVKGR